MKDFVNVGLLGAGTVGGGVLKVLEKNAEKIAKEVGKPVRITKVLDRHVDRLKQEYGDKYIFTDNADEVLEDKDIDIIVELLGREHPAKEFIARAFANGKHVVTANKDVLANLALSCSHWRMSITATLCLRPASAAVFLSSDQ